MNKEKLLRYAAIKSEIKRLSIEADEIKPEIINAMKDENADEIVLPDIGKFYFKDKRTWTYSDSIMLLEEELKKDKKVAQQKGMAECVITKELNFRGLNEQGTEEI